MQARRRLGFTLIELLIVVALVAIVLTLAVPSFREFIVVQRLKSINAQIVTDLQYARAESVSRGVPVRVRFQSTGLGSPATLSCYIIYTDTVVTPPSQPYSSPLCDCKAAEGSRCTAPGNTTVELRTVQVTTDLAAMVGPVSAAIYHFAFDPRTGGLALPPVDAPPPYPGEFAIESYIDSSRKFVDLVGRSGRVKTCIPVGSKMPGEPCPTP
jgi:type IV fimbrial biogenesis protein FimT